MRLAYCALFCMSLVIADHAPVPKVDMERLLKPRTELIKKIGTAKGEERDAILRYLTGERIDVGTDLTRLFEAATDNETRFTAAFLLGYFRIETCVPVLSKQITLYAGFPNTLQQALWTEYPIVEALIRIGNPSIPAMLDNIRTTDDENIRKLSVRVIRYVEGPEIGRFVLQNDLEKRTDPQIKARLQAAIVAFDELVKATTK